MVVLLRTMSRTELYIVKKDGTLELYKEFGNSHRGASLLWDNLMKKYLNSSYGRMMMNDKEMEKLWRLDRDPKVSREEKILLISTFDHMLIKKENLKQFIDACEEVYKNFEELGHFNTYPEVMKEIMKLEDVIAIGWNQTSVCCDVWDVYETCTHCDDGTIRRDYNIFKDNKHEFLFEYLKEIE